MHLLKIGQKETQEIISKNHILPDQINPQNYLNPVERNEFLMFYFVIIFEK